MQNNLFSPLKKHYPTEELLKIMKKDKKAIADKITLIIPKDKKSVREVKLSTDEVEEILTSIEG